MHVATPDLSADESAVMDALTRMADPAGETTSVVAVVASEASRRESVTARAVRKFIEHGTVRHDKDRRRLVLLGSDRPRVTDPQEPPTVAPGTVPEPAAEAPNVSPATRTPEREVDYRTAVMDAPGLSIGARYTGVAIVRHCWRSRELFAGMETVAGWVGLSPESRKTVGKYIAELATAGFLTEMGRAGRSVKYGLTIPA